MPDVTVDITSEEGELAIENPQGFDLRFVVPGLTVDMTHKQGAALYTALNAFFGPEEGGNG